MLKTLVGGFYYVINRIEIQQNRLQRLETTPEQLADGISALIDCFKDLKRFCDEYDLTETGKYLDVYVERITWNNVDRTRAAFIAESVLRVVENEAEARWVYHLSRTKHELFISELKKWQPICEKFKVTETEAVSALKCYLFGENTACIFHLMRAAEIGLRALARERRIRIPKKPLDWVEWQEILTHIGRSVDNLAKTSKRGPTKDAALSFYQGALGEFGAFKDTYRNLAMHARKSFDEHEAASALLHVREVMLRLSSRLSDDHKGAIKWGKF